MVRSKLIGLTPGRPVTVQFPLAGVADAMLGQLRTLCQNARLESLAGHQLMAERSLLLELAFKQGISAGGSCHLLSTLERPIAINLPRESDWELIPAWLECNDDALRQPGNWDALEAHLGSRGPGLVARGRELGLAVAATGDTVIPREVFDPTGMAVLPGVQSTRPRVIDLSALWAGPLATHLLWLCGADVIKVESVARPDGGRSGNAAFYGLLNQGKHSVALDLRRHAGQRALLRLIEHADIVIESSRPRALRQMGIEADAIVAGRPSLTWISITGYGRSEPRANWIAYGDDAGIAAGMGDLMNEACGSFEFAGDAIADPLTGIDAAIAALHGWHSGGAGLVPIALVDVVAWAMNEQLAASGRANVLSQLRAWWRSVRTDTVVVNRREANAPVARLGEHTAQVLRELDIQC